MRPQFKFAGLLFLGLLTRSALSDPALIPLPVEMTSQPGAFEWRAGTPVDAPSGAAMPLALLREYFGPLVGKTAPDAPVVFQQDPALSGEAYELEITPQHVFLRAGDAEGWDNAIQTLRELMPPARLAAPGAEPLSLPCLRIKDAPRFRWRGLMLDCSRHFFSTAFIKKFLDVMALHKFNVFHWHLTDDQGWRLEIEKYPRLTETGAWREENGRRYGGFYTQDEARDIVRYAAARGITVVPEIEMPGHSLAALAAYPELSCGGGPFEVASTFGIKSHGVYCVGKENVYAFLDDVLTEVVRIFPSPYIHIGGDEVNKTDWRASPEYQALMKAQGLKNEDELQSYFIRRVQKILAAKGRRLIGWDEILEGGLAPGAVVMSWRGNGAGGLAATQTGDDVVMSPQKPLYFDHSYQENSVAAVYGYDPIPPGLTPAQAAHVLGAQGNIWTEHIPGPDDVEEWAYPRACALAEVDWSAPGAKNFDDFSARLNRHLQRLAALGVKYHDTVVIASWKSGGTTEIATPHEWDVTGRIDGGGTCRVRFQYTVGAHRLDIAGAELVANGVVVASDPHAGTTGGYDRNNLFTFAVPPLAPGAKVVLRATVRSDGGTDSNGEILLEK